MGGNEASTFQGLPIIVSGRRAPAWWGMWLLIVTEATLFAIFIAAYFNVRGQSQVWPPDSIPRPEWLVPSINTVILLSSSIPMFIAERSIRRGNQRGLKLGLAFSFVLGAIFLGIQLFRVSQLPFGPQTDAYASAFFTLTGFHAAHLVVGLVMSGVTQLLAWLGYFSASRFLTVQTTAMYWHFVDAVWIAVFATLHLSPYVL